MTNLYSVIRPVVFSLPAETAHGLTIRALKMGLWPGKAKAAYPGLGMDLWGLHFPNPVGLAAGFDKNGEVPDRMLKLGFGFAEVGTVTPRPQPGNARPRLFRLVEDRAVINRFGFNNEGLEALAARLEARRNHTDTAGIVGGNVGANKDSADPVTDYVAGIQRLYGLVDYFTVNVSSPNTPGLRNLQHKEALDRLLAAVLEARAQAHARQNAGLKAEGGPVPLLLKIAPDLSEAEQADIAETALERGVDGMIVSNTTVERPQDLQSRHKAEGGGLSGAPLFDPSTKVLANIYRLTGGKLPLVGVGGISNARQAYAKIRAGASLVQIYSAMVYEGPGLAARICEGLADLLANDGFDSVSDAVGAGD